MKYLFLKNYPFLIILVGLFIFVSILFQNIILKQKQSSPQDVVIESGSLHYYFERTPGRVYYKYPPWHGEGGYIIEVNSDTLDDTKEYSINKGDNTFRIIILGDSYTDGAYIDTVNHWPEYLEKLLNININCPDIHNFEVINLGVYSYDIRYSVERFKRRGLKYNPDFVIWLTHDEDRYQINELLFPAINKFGSEMKKSGEYQKEVEGGNIYPEWGEARDYVENMLGTESILKEQREYFDQFKSIYPKKLLLVTFPSTDEKYMGILKDFDKANDTVELLSDITDIQENENYVQQDGHPTVEGHKMIAKDIYNYLVDKVITCSSPL